MPRKSAPVGVFLTALIPEVLEFLRTIGCSIAKYFFSILQFANLVKPQLSKKFISAVDKVLSGTDFEYSNKAVFVDPNISVW